MAFPPPLDDGFANETETAGLKDAKPPPDEFAVSPESRQRLDQLLVERGLVESRAKAQALVLAGQVFSGERRLDKPGQGVPADLALEVRKGSSPYVSRGGQKLAHGLDHFGIDPKGMVGLDLGASTGGFTDVLLQRGATKVYAVDVGHGQLDWRLRNDPQSRCPGADQRPLPEPRSDPRAARSRGLRCELHFPEARPSGSASTELMPAPAWVGP